MLLLGRTTAVEEGVQLEYLDDKVMVTVFWVKATKTILSDDCARFSGQSSNEQAKDPFKRMAGK